MFKMWLVRKDEKKKKEWTQFAINNERKRDEEIDRQRLKDISIMKQDKSWDNGKMIKMLQ